MKPHPETDRLREVLARCENLAQAWAGVVYRSASVAYANRDDLLTGSGAKRAGGRWNRPNSVATVYTSLEIETAVGEALAHHHYYDIPIEQALPRILVSIRVVLGRVLNLADARTRRRLAIARSQLLTEDWRATNANDEEARTQSLGRLAWEAAWGCEGLLVPSAADAGGVDLIVFPGNLVPPKSYLLIINRDQLPSPL